MVLTLITSSVVAIKIVTLVAIIVIQPTIIVGVRE